ncbi:MAG: AMP-binding protein [Pirellulaceae bacterium]|nr:AMP-binding protein [Pirellulaceae bacterium]
MLNVNGEYSSLAVEVLSRALNDPNRAAFCKISNDASAGRWFGWGQIGGWVCDACEALESLSLPIGTHLATVARNSVEWFVLDFACQALGYVHVAIDHRWPEVMVGTLIEHSCSQVVYIPQSQPSVELQAKNRVHQLEWRFDLDLPPISKPELQKWLRRAALISDELPAQMLFTSGTSGQPKGVLLSHRNLVSNAWAKLDAAPQVEDDLRLNILPFCHAYARTCELSTWVLSNSRLAIATDWDDFLRQASVLRPTLINLVPHLANKLVHQTNTKEQLQPHEIAARLGGQVRLLQVGGAAISDDLWHALANSGLPPLQGYGLTEASPVVCSNRAGEQRPGRIGPPVMGVELRVDAVGQLWVRGEGVMLGYHRNPTATQTRIQDGWLATGDLVDLDELGHYRVTGRLSEVMVLSTGLKVSPESIEGRMEAVEGIERAVLVGESRPYLVALIWPAWRDLPNHLFVDGTRDPASLNLARFHAQLTDWVRGVLSDLPAYALPRKFIVVWNEVDSNLFTAKGSLRRQAVIVHFQAQIDEAYAVTANISDL